MLFSLLGGGGDLRSIVLSLLLYLPMMLLALSLHETAHGYVAYKCGDPTAYNLGRLTLNPLKHFDPMGALFMLLLGFGWAKPVPINTRNFRNSKRGMALTAAAGPVSNLLLGSFCAAVYGALEACYAYLIFTGAEKFLVTCVFWLAIMFLQGAQINFIFAVFNLIPVPPFDGSRIAYVFLPERLYFNVMRYERQIMLGILIALFALSHFFHFSPFAWAAEKLTYWVAQPVIQLFYKLFASLI